MTSIRELCSGYGGLGLAVEQVTGGTVVDHAEIDTAAAKVHDTHWPGIPNLGDITTLDWAALNPTDILCAGFPCQPISQAGRRKVTNDARWLWPHIAHAVRVLRPGLVVLENVPPLLRPWRDDDGWWNPAPIEEVAGDLAALGYVGRWRSVRAADVGAPHRRERVFIAAVHADHVGRQGAQPWPLGNPRRGRGPTADAVCAGAGWDGRAAPRPPEGARRTGAGLHSAVDGRAAAADADVLQRGRARDAEPGDCGQAHVGRGAAQPRGRHSAPADSAGVRGPYEPISSASQGQPVVTVDRASGRDHRWAAAEGVLELERAAALLAWGPYGPAVRRWERTIGRTPPAPVDHLGRLSPAFSEWMMGLPDGWVTAIPISRTAQLSVIGNGVVPQAAAVALTDLLQPWELAA